MGISRVFAARGRMSGLAAALGLAFTIAVTASPAEAARKRHAKRSSYAPPYAALVVDAGNGRVLHAQNETALRHPASVTKVMTLYMLFEQLEKGRYRLDSPLRVSARAAAMAPSKIGFQPGETIEVEDAIKALVTKSANDVAATVAENIAGDEDSFAELMTRRARSLGMSSTVYRNASGLPDPEQVTTARDLAILGRAIQSRFPQYYKFFGTPAFNYGGAVYKNHNKLLGRIEGVDGIKTGYTRASGFNLLTSARRDGRHIVAVVLGGRSGRARDLIMANLVHTQIARASISRGGSQFASRRFDEDEAPPARVAAGDADLMRPAPVAAERPRLAAAPVPPVPTPMAAAVVAAAQTQKARPAVVSAEADSVTTASVHGRDGAPRVISGQRPVVAAASTPAPLRWVAGPAGRSADAPRPPASVPEKIRTARVEVPTKAVKTEPAPKAEPVSKAEKARAEKLAAAEKPDRDAKPAARGKNAKAEKPEKAEKAQIAARDAGRKDRGEPAHEKPSGKSGWVIQIGAIDDLAKANALLARAKSERRSALAGAQSYTEKVQKGDSTLYRARFAGLGADEAETTCRQLKRSGFSCFATRN
jgi:D-alanyl-D-alanine carboxypeptidase